MLNLPKYNADSIDMKNILACILLFCTALFSAPIAQLNEFSDKIDGIIQKQSTAINVKLNDIVDEDAFIRRAYLSIIGRSPTYEEYELYSKAPVETRRQQVIAFLMKHPGHVSHMFNFWSESLRLRDRLTSINNFSGGPYIDYIKDSIASNKPYNKFVSDLLTSTGSYYDNPATGYFYRDLGMPLDNLIATGKVFMATDIGCAQCHDDPFQDFTQMQFYKMAAMFTQVELRGRGKDKDAAVAARQKALREEVDALIKADPMKNRGLNNQINNFVAAMRANLEVDEKRTLNLPHDYNYKDAKPNDAVEPAVLQGKTTINNKNDMRKDVVAWLVNPEHPTFTKNIVNRYWKWVFGKYIIDDYDNIHDSDKLNGELMNALAKIFIAVNYDSRQFLYVLYNTKLFQRKLYDGAYSNSDKFVFIGPVKQRLSAEQLWDSVLSIAVIHPESFKLSFQDEYVKVMQYTIEDLTIDKLKAKNELYQNIMRTKYDAASKYRNYPLVRASEVNDNSTVNTILEQLGRGDRELIDTSSREGSVTQVISFMNGQLAEIAINKDTHLAKNIAGKASADVVEIIFKSVLSREPTLEEKSKFAGVQDDDIIWALINCSEFKFNK
jgi:hypothetical protein